MVFHGVTEFTFVAAKNANGQEAHTVFDREKNLVKVKHFPELNLQVDVSMATRISPSVYGRIIETCDKAGAGFDHQRVDVFVDLTTGHVALGEVTTGPWGGVVTWDPDSFHDVLTKLWGCDEEDFP